PALELGGHGCVASVVKGRHAAQDAQPHRLVNLRRRGHRERHPARQGRAAHQPSPRRRQRDHHADLPHRYRRGGRVLQERRRPALRAAQSGARGLSERAMATVLVEHVVAMARNNAWANHRLLSACEALTPDEFAAPRTSFSPSLRATFNHILAVDWYYIDALEELDALRHYSGPRPDFADAQSMRLAQTASDRRLIAFCERQTDESLAADCVLPRPNRRPPPTPVARVLEHLFHHQVHHPGQPPARPPRPPLKP